MSHQPISETKIRRSMEENMLPLADKANAGFGEAKQP
jgi:hypothetical protein